MAKRLLEKQIEEIVQLFISGVNIEQLSKRFSCTKLTISRNLKKNLGEEIYKELSIKSKSNNNLKENIEFLNKNKKVKKIKTNNESLKKNSYQKVQEDFFESSQFFEVAPLNCEIENSAQKDLSSIPIADVDFPETVFMIVDKKIELEIKYLKDYPK